MTETRAVQRDLRGAASPADAFSVRDGGSATGAASSEDRARGACPANRWLVLVVACLAQFMVVLDPTVVNVALPSVQRGLHFSAANLQWVVNGYTLMFGGLLLLGGRAADLLGRKRLFIAGVIVFAGASLLNGVAQSSGMLIAGRGLQGLGAALVSPAALSIVTTTFADARERTKALAVWTAISAGGSGFGLLVGGALTGLVSWRWIFFINAPIGVAAVALALRYVTESGAAGSRRGYDLAGAVTVTIGLITLVYAIVKAQAHGWGSTPTLGLGTIAVILLAAFVVSERRSRAPLMRLSIFRVRSLTVGDAALLFHVRRHVRDVLLRLPVRPGRPRLRPTQGRAGVPAGSREHHARLGRRSS